MKNIINIINKRFKPLKVLNDYVDKRFINNLKYVIKYYNVNSKEIAIKIIDELDNKEMDLSSELKNCINLIKKDLQN